MNIPIDENVYLKIRDSLFGGTFTFRKGKIGEWKTVYTDELKEMFKQNYGSLLIEMGYEQDENW